MSPARQPGNRYFKIEVVREDADAIQQMFETVSLGAPENAVGFVLWRIVARYQREMDKMLGEIDLTHLQFVTLALAAWFGRSGEPVNQAELARFGGIHPMQISNMLRTLESKSFISRRQSNLDTRAKQIRVTRDGLKVLRQALPRAIEVQSRIFGDEGRPSGSLLATLLELDRRLAPVRQD